MKVLMVLTSYDKLGDNGKTVRLESVKQED